MLTGIQVQYDEGPERTRALGWYAVALASGAVSGQLAGGLLVSIDVLGLGWRPIFLINLPITLATLLLGSRLLPRGSTDKTTRLDLPGAAALFLAVLALIAPLTLGREEGWPVWTWISLSLGAPLFIGFLAIERWQSAAGRAPLVDLALARRPPIAWGLWPQAITSATYMGLLLTLALYLQAGLGYSPLESGSTLLPWVIAFAVPGRVLHRLPDRMRKFVPAAGCLLLAAAYLGLSATALGGVHAETALLAILAVGGLGLGTTFSSMLVRLTSVTPVGHAAHTSGTSATALQVTGAVGVAAFGSLYLSQLGGSGVEAAGHAFGVVTAAFALAALAAAAVAHRALRVSSGTV